MSIRKWMKFGIPIMERWCWRQPPLEKQFESIILSHLQPGHLVLDVGCGITTYANIKGKCRMVIGIDADTEVTRNKYVDAIIHADLYHLPFPDNTFNVVMSWTVLEHIDDPQACFNELSRVCMPGGLMVHTTPNLLHYANLFIRTTPFKFHKWFIRRIMGQNDKPYPTRYKVNTPGQLKKILSKTGFLPLEIKMVDTGPVYLGWLAPAYAVGLLYHHLVNRFNPLSLFRSFMIAVSIRRSECEVRTNHE